MLQAKDVDCSANPPDRRVTDRHAPALRVVELAGSDDFRSLMHRQALRCRRDGEACSVLSLLAEPADALAPDLRQALFDDCARRLCGRVRITDTVARWPVGHFGVLLPGCQSVHAAAVLARLQRAASGTYNLADQTLQLRLHGQVLLPAAL